MKTLIIAKRLIKQIATDKRSIGLMFLAPVFVIYLLSIILTSSGSQPTIDVISAPKAFVEALSKNAVVNSITDESKAIENLKSGKADAYIVFSGTTPSITVEGSDPTSSNMVIAVIKKAIYENMPSQLGLPPGALVPDLQNIKYLFGSESMETFDSLAPLFMGFFIFFFVFLLAGVSFLRERISGTLERVLATPLRRSEIVCGYFLGFGLFVALQTIIIQSFIVYGLDVVMNGSFWLVLVINLILAGQSLAVGTLLSSFARNEFQLFQFIPIVIVPQILFSGICDLSEAPMWVSILSKAFPLTYGSEALRGVMLKGQSFLKVQKEIFILIGYAVFFLILNTAALKKYRKT